MYYARRFGFQTGHPISVQFTEKTLWRETDVQPLNANNLLPITGLVYDIVGAILLAEAIVRSRHKILVLQARNRGQFPTANLALFSALEEQRHDARFGLGLLIIGFGLQLGGAIGYFLPFDWPYAITLVALLLGVVIWWCVSGRQIAATRRDRLAGSFEGLERLNFLRNNPDQAESE